jgi:hypothetical protein
MLYIPGAILIRSSFMPAEVTLFSDVSRPAAIRFPNGKVWLIGLPKASPKYDTYEFCMRPWVQHNCGAAIDAVVLPGIGTNSIHDLWPVVESRRVKRLIVNALPEGAAGEDLESFTRDHGIDLVVNQGITLMLPAPRCSTTIMRRHNDSLAVRIAVNGVSMHFGGHANEKTPFLGGYTNETTTINAAMPPKERRRAANTKKKAITIVIPQRGGPRTKML